MPYLVPAKKTNQVTTVTITRRVHGREALRAATVMNPLIVKEMSREFTTSELLAGLTEVIAMPARNAPARINNDRIATSRATAAKNGKM